MKIRKIKILFWRGWTKVLATVSLSLFSLVCGRASAQKAGDVITGFVHDGEGPMIMANVTERDQRERIVSHAITDIEGNFALRVVNPADTLEITYIGYERVRLPIDTTHFDVLLKPGDMPKVDIVSERYAVKVIDMSQYDSIEFINEELVGIIPGRDIVYESGDLAYGPPSVRNRQVFTEFQKPLSDGVPLVILNGEELCGLNVQKLKALDLNDIDRKALADLIGVRKRKIKEVTVLKDAAATAVWGRLGRFGVIDIKTK